MTVAPAMKIVPSAPPEGGRNQVPTAAGGIARVGSALNSHSSTSLSGSAGVNANWQSVLSSLGVRISGQYELEGAKGESQSSTEPVGEESSDEPFNAHSPLVVATGLHRNPASSLVNTLANSGNGKAAAVALDALSDSKPRISFSGALATGLQQSELSGNTKTSDGARRADSEGALRPVRLEQKLRTQVASSATEQPSAPVVLGVASPSNPLTTPIGFEAIDVLRASPVSDGFATPKAHNLIVGLGSSDQAAAKNEAAGPAWSRGNQGTNPLPSSDAAVGREADGSREVALGPLPHDAPASADVVSKGSTGSSDDHLELPSSDKGGDPVQLLAPHTEPIQNPALKSGPVHNPNSFADPQTAAVPIDKDQRVSLGTTTHESGVQIAEPAVTAAKPPVAEKTKAAAQNSLRTPVGAAGFKGGEEGNRVALPQPGSNTPAMSGLNLASPTDATGTHVGVASSTESVGASASNSGISGEVFSALDKDSASGSPTWIHAGARRAEAGFQDPALGWVSVRADLTGGSIHAALIPGSDAAAQTLGGHLAGLNAYLAEHHTAVEALTLATPGSGVEDAGRFSSGSQGMQQGAGQGTGQGFEAARQSHAETEARPFSAVTIPASAGRHENPTQPSVAAGLHISVMA